MKWQVDLKRINREFEVGYWVFVRVRPYKQISLEISKNHKLVPKVYGPYQIQKDLDKWHIL